MPRRCLAKDTHVTLANGSTKFIQDIKRGDEVLSFDGEKVVKDVVKDCWYTGKKDAIEIKSSKFTNIVTSKDHRFYSKGSWIRAEELKDNTYLAQQNLIHSLDNNPLLSELIGFLTHDGHVVEYRQPKFTHKKIDIFKRVEFLVGELFNCSVIRIKKGNCFELVVSNGSNDGGFNNNKVKDLFRQCGQDVPRSKKRIHPIIWNQSRESVLSYLRAVISSDGNIYLREEESRSLGGRIKGVKAISKITISCGSSYWLAQDTYWLLRKIGFVPQAPKREANWKISIRRANDIIELLSGRIYGKQKQAHKVLASITHSPRAHVPIHNGNLLSLSSHRSEEVGEREMYDIETTHNHNFFANGYLVHNSGKDIAAWNLAIRQCIKKICIVYYIFPTYSQAKKVIWDSITSDGKRFTDFIPNELIKSKNSQEMKITFVNGSILQLIGSDNIDSIVGTNPYGCIFSEYAIQDPRAYQFIRPILAANDGWALFISCVSPETLVITDNGFKRISKICSSREKYSDLNKPIYGLNGFNTATDFYYGGEQKTLKIKLSSGYELECTPIHPLWNGSEWVKAKDIKIGDLFPVQYGQNVFGKGLDISEFEHGLRVANGFPISFKEMDFFYLLGLIHADGSYDKNKVTITNKSDRKIRNFLSRLKFKKYGIDDIHYSYGSKSFCAFLEWLGFKHGSKNKTFPERLFKCTKEQLRCFLQGLFDGDGTSNSNPSKWGCIKLTSTCENFIKDIQIVLLNFGIVSSYRKEEKKPTKKVHVHNTIFNLEIVGYFAHVFYEKIGFRLERKQENKMHIPEKVKQESGNIYPVDATKLSFKLPKNMVTKPSKMSRRTILKLIDKYGCEYLKSLISEYLFFSPIASIETSSSEVFDFVIPSTHSFFSNGFISHNTPRGKNSFWELFQVAKNHEDWFAYHLTLDDTKHIPYKEIEREREEGLMSEDLIRQEYYCDFSLGVEGAYYAKYLDKMKLNNQIGSVVYEPGFKVHTAWDLGVRDSTSIIFFQTIGQTVRIIDCYENSKEGLEHYVKVINSKDYIYGTHIAPHDIKVKEFGSGLTRIEKAKQLGIRFTVAPNISIEDGIETVRSSFAKMWIDEQKCEKLLKAINNYRQEFDSKKKVYKPRPLHDIYSHFCDALRYLCLSLPKTRDGLSAEDLEKRYRSAVYGQDDLPSFFR